MGRTSGRASADGSMVVAMPDILQSPITWRQHVTPSGRCRPARSSPARCSACGRPGCPRGSSCARARCSASPRAPPASPSPAWWRPASSSPTATATGSAGRCSPARPARTRPATAPTRGWDGRWATAGGGGRGPRPAGPGPPAGRGRRAPPGRAPRGRVDCGRTTCRAGVLPDDEAVVAAPVPRVPQPSPTATRPSSRPTSGTSPAGRTGPRDLRRPARRRRRRRSTAGDLDALAEGFVLSAATLRHFQADPLLPPELLPDALAGRARSGPTTTSTTPPSRRVWRDWYREQRAAIGGGERAGAAVACRDARRATSGR